MKVIGLAGRPGSGKSAVAEQLARRPGVAWINLDELAWTAYAPGTSTYHQLIDGFGESICAQSGEIDREALARQAFQSPKHTERLNAIVHPAISAELKRRIRLHGQQGTKVLLVEGALLASSPDADRTEFHVMVWLDVPDAVRAERLSACGREKHLHRADAVEPRGDVLVLSGVGSIEDVAERLSHQIAKQDV